MQFIRIKSYWIKWWWINQLLFIRDVKTSSGNESCKNFRSES